MNKSLKKIVNIWGTISFFVLIILCLSAFSLLMISHSTNGINSSDEFFMNLAYEEAASALKFGDAPVGAVFVINKSVIAKAHNQVELGKDHRNHAEMLVINEALQRLKISDFSQIEGDITLYTTYEPCPMCEGFIVWKKVPRVIVGQRKGFGHLLDVNYMGHILYRFNERVIDEEVHNKLFKQWIKQE
jgi:tRNA(adenine34) deaminase